MHGHGQLGAAVATQTTAAVIGDKRFLEEILTDEQRQELLFRIIEARLDSSATDLARSTASQLAGKPHLEDFSVRYTAKNVVPEPHALYEQKFLTTQRPLPRFQFLFQVFQTEDETKTHYDPNVFTWRYWLAPKGEDVDQVLKTFQVTRVAVNGTTLPGVTLIKDSAIPNAVSYETSYSDTATPPDNRYHLEMDLRLPAPKEGSFFYVEPRWLCKSISVECVNALSEFDVVPVETLRASNVQVEKTKDRSGRAISTRVHTGHWVLPTASVAFVFYTPTKDYNKPIPETEEATETAPESGVNSAAVL